MLRSNVDFFSALQSDVMRSLFLVSEFFSVCRFTTCTWFEFNSYVLRKKSRNDFMQTNKWVKPYLECLIKLIVNFPWEHFFHFSCSLPTTRYFKWSWEHCRNSSAWFNAGIVPKDTDVMHFDRIPAYSRLWLRLITNYKSFKSQNTPFKNTIQKKVTAFTLHWHVQQWQQYIGIFKRINRKFFPPPKDVSISGMSTTNRDKVNSKRKSQSRNEQVHFYSNYVN